MVAQGSSGRFKELGRVLIYDAAAACRPGQKAPKLRLIVTLSRQNCHFSPRLYPG